MNVSPQTQAVLLLTAHFSKPRPDDTKPLTPTEWGKFALWLRDAKIGPETLLSGGLREKLSGWCDAQITRERIDRLLERGSALALAMEKWLRSGLWILTRSDVGYPSRLKQRLGPNAPAVLFGSGNASLLGRVGLAVVGSRNASEDDLEYSRLVGERAAQARVSVVSGGARGVDEAATLGALESEGAAIAVLADSLLRASTSTKYRKHLLADSLALVSPYYPEVGFSVGNAMGRNKYIYCLADAAVVVHSGRNGGTWSGACENLSRSWVRVWVKPTSDPSAGNADIVRRGASWLPEQATAIDLEALLSGANVDASEPQKPDVVAGSGGVAETAASYTSGDAGAAGAGASRKVDEPEAAETIPVATLSPRDSSFYEFFLLKVEALCRDRPRTAAELEKRLELSKAQLGAWIKQAVTDKKLKKLARPVRYEWIGDERQQSIFGHSVPGR